MTLLQELQEKEIALKESTDALLERYNKESLELRAIRKAIETLSGSKPQGVPRAKSIKWTKERYEQLLKWREEGVTFVQIGKRLGISADAAWQAHSWWNKKLKQAAA